MKKVLVIGDSLSLPRPDGKVKVHETWLSKLMSQMQKHNFHQACRRGMHSKDALETYVKGSFLKSSFDYLILQVGIVDCAPRYLTENESKILRNLPFSNKIYRVIKKFRLLFLKRNISYVSKENYYSNIKTIINLINPNIKTIIIPIAPATDDYETILPGVSDKIKSYNATLHSLETDNIVILNCYKPSFECFLEDQHHLDVNGHEKVYNSLKEILES